MAETARMAVFHGAGTPFGLSHYEAEHLRGALDMMARTRDRYRWDRIVSHKLPLEAIEEAFVQQDKGHVTRAAIVPN